MVHPKAFHSYHSLLTPCPFEKSLRHLTLLKLYLAISMGTKVTDTLPLNILLTNSVK